MGKYEKGEKITSLDVLMEQDVIYFTDRVTNRGWFQNWYIGRAKMYIELGLLFKAKLKGESK